MEKIVILHTNDLHSHLENWPRIRRFLDQRKRENEKKENALIRSSAAEYLTFVASTGEDRDSIEMRSEDENIWLTQKMMATLYDVSVPAINQHLKRYMRTEN